jgi:Flp pilus assembly protein TadG
VTLRHVLRRLGRDKAGVTVVEFALLSPLMIVMLFGVLQMGVMLQSYNAVRHVAADVARHAMVQYATGNDLNNDELTLYARGIATGAPYLLSSTLVVNVTDVTTSAVTGATEKTLTVNYEIPSILSTMGLNGPWITYARPLFLTTPGT